MREILFRGKDPETGKWYEGSYMALSDTTYCFKEDYAAHPENTKHYIVFDKMTDWCLPNRHLRADVDPSTVGQYTGLNDKNGVSIFEGDIVDLFGMKGKVVQECGAFGIAFMKTIDYDLLESKMPFNNSANFCFNDNFISLWEIFWNYEQGDNTLYDVEVIGNVHDNPDLLEK